MIEDGKRDIDIFILYWLGVALRLDNINVLFMSNPDEHLKNNNIR